MIRRCWNRVSVKKKEKKRQRSEIYYFTDCYSRANRQPWAEISTTIRSELDGIHSVPKPHSLPRKIPIEKVHNSSGKSLSARKLRPHPPWRSNDWNSPFEWTGEEAARKYLSSFFSPFSTRLSLSLSTFFPPIFFFLFFFLFVPSFVTPVRLGSRECGATISRTRHYTCQKQQYRIRMCPFPGGRGGDIAIRRK